MSYIRSSKHGRTHLVLPDLLPTSHIPDTAQEMYQTERNKHLMHINSQATWNVGQFVENGGRPAMISSGQFSHFRAQTLPMSRQPSAQTATSLVHPPYTLSGSQNKTAKRNGVLDELPLSAKSLLQTASLSSVSWMLRERSMIYPYEHNENPSYCGNPQGKSFSGLNPSFQSYASSWGGEQVSLNGRREKYGKVQQNHGKADTQTKRALWQDRRKAESQTKRALWQDCAYHPSAALSETVKIVDSAKCSDGDSCMYSSGEDSSCGQSSSSPLDLTFLEESRRSKKLDSPEEYDNVSLASDVDINDVNYFPLGWSLRKDLENMPSCEDSSCGQSSSSPLDLTFVEESRRSKKLDSPEEYDNVSIASDVDINGVNYFPLRWSLRKDLENLPSCEHKENVNSSAKDVLSTPKDIVRSSRSQGNMLSNSFESPGPSERNYDPLGWSLKKKKNQGKQKGQMVISTFGDVSTLNGAGRSGSPDVEQVNDGFDSSPSPKVRSLSFGWSSCQESENCNLHEANGCSSSKKKKVTEDASTGTYWSGNLAPVAMRMLQTHQLRREEMDMIIDGEPSITATGSEGKALVENGNARDRKRANVKIRSRLIQLLDLQVKTKTPLFVLTDKLKMLKPYVISGWISDSYLKVLMQKTEMFGGEHDNALDNVGEIKADVVEKCLKTNAVVFTRELVYRVFTLGELENTGMKFRRLSKRKMAAVQRCVKREFPHLTQKMWSGSCLWKLRCHLTFILSKRVRKVQRFWQREMQHAL